MVEKRDLMVLDRETVTRLASETLRTAIDPNKSVNLHYGFGGDDIDDLCLRLCDIYGVDPRDFAERLDFNRYFYQESGVYQLYLDIKGLIVCLRSGRHAPRGDEPFFIHDFVAILEECRRSAPS